MRYLAFIDSIVIILALIGLVLSIAFVPSVAPALASIYLLARLGYEILTFIYYTIGQRLCEPYKPEHPDDRFVDIARRYGWIDQSNRSPIAIIDYITRFYEYSICFDLIRHRSFGYIKHIAKLAFYVLLGIAVLIVSRSSEIATALAYVALLIGVLPILIQPIVNKSDQPYRSKLTEMILGIVSIAIDWFIVATFLIWR